MVGMSSIITPLRCQYLFTYMVFLGNYILYKPQDIS